MVCYLPVLHDDVLWLSTRIRNESRPGLHNDSRVLGTQKVYQSLSWSTLEVRGNAIIGAAIVRLYCQVLVLSKYAGAKLHTFPAQGVASRFMLFGEACWFDSSSRCIIYPQSIKPCVQKNSNSTNFPQFPAPIIQQLQFPQMSSKNSHYPAPSQQFPPDRLEDADELGQQQLVS